MPRPAPAFASGEPYAMATTKSCYFYKEKNGGRALFAIPYTYCVEILHEDGDWYRVRYAEDEGLYTALYGYCLKEGLTPVSVPPENIYLNMPVTVTYRPDEPPTSLPVLSEMNVTAAYYGTYDSDGTALSYVSYEGSFGYIYGANDEYPLNEIPEEESKPASGGSAKSGKTKAIVACALCALAAGALLFLYFSGKRYFVKRGDG